MEEILRDFGTNWYVYLSMPVLAAVIGYVTKILAIEMMFKPVEFVGKPPVFGWQGMGRLFVNGLLSFEPNPVMAFFIVTAVSIVVFNLIADILYAFLDPRIRLA